MKIYDITMSKDEIVRRFDIFLPVFVSFGFLVGFGLGLFLN